MKLYAILLLAALLIAAIGSGTVYVINAERTKKELALCRIAKASCEHLASEQSSNARGLREACRRHQLARNDLQDKLQAADRRASERRDPVCPPAGAGVDPEPGDDRLGRLLRELAVATGDNDDPSGSDPVPDAGPGPGTDRPDERGGRGEVGGANSAGKPVSP